MIEIRRKDELGQTKLDWLHARHHFSFGSYYDSSRMSFGPIRVINDDRIQAGTGFDMHPHKNMEIITYVKSGAIHHRDSLGNHGVTAAGDIQIMSAGSGILHSEYASPDEETTLYQIWLMPEANDLPPRWEQTELPRGADGLKLVASGNSEAAGVLKIHQKADLFAGTLPDGQTQTLDIGGYAYVLVASGEVEVDGHALNAGDAALVGKQNSVELTALSDTEILLLNV